jgi:hypothetical protein
VFDVSGFDGTEFFIGEGSGGASDAHFVIDASGKVGIGETSPDELLHIKSSTASNPVIKLENAGDVTNGAQLHFVMSTTSEGDNDIPGTIRFKGQNDASEETEFATIYARNIDVSDGTEDGELHFRTIAAGSLDTSMIIKSGKVGIGNANPTHPLTVQGDISGSGRGTFGSHIFTAGNVYLDGEEVLNSADSATTLTLGGDSDWTQVNYGKDTDVVHNFRGTMISGSATSTGSFGSALIDGFVGIGTKTPRKQFHSYSAGGVNIVGLFESSDSQALIAFRDNSTGDDNHVMIGANGTSFAISTDNTQRVEVDSSGNVTLNSGVALEFGDSNTKILGSSVGNYLSFTPNGTELLKLVGTSISGSAISKVQFHLV